MISTKLSEKVRQGDFTSLAKAYKNRTGYSLKLLNFILNTVALGKDKGSLVVVEAGAGTGKLLENLLQIDLDPIIAIEPNNAMRYEGELYLEGKNVDWRNGSGEETGLDTGSVDWMLMGSSFHWVNLEKGLAEFHRILKDGAYFTAIWNPRNLEVSELHMRIEAKIYDIVTGLKRKSSGSAKFQKNLSRRITSTGHFKDVMEIETPYEVIMTKERYMNIWHSTNDIQAQAGPQRWAEVLEAIENEIRDLDEIRVPYKSRAWIAQRA